MANAVTTPRALTATVVAVSAAERMKETSAALAALRARSAVRTILISLGDNPQPPIKSEEDMISIEELVPRYLNNAVASLRLSSLPSIAWWRGGDIGALTDLADLVDRLVLDSEDPRDAWSAAAAIADLTSISDLRWTRLTRWRNLMAQFFDVPDVRGAIGSFTALQVTASDPHTARLFAGWMKSRLPEGNTLAITVSAAAGEAAIESVSLNGSSHRLSLELTAEGTCILTSIETGGRTIASRIVPLGDQSPAALMAEELRVRARELVFEQALLASAGLSS